jgi:class 3 adenylate cyclase
VVLDPERSLAAVLFTDIVGSTEKAAALGDRVWRGLLHRHHAAVRRELRRHGGREIATAGDGFLSVFDHPAAAIVCACAIRDALRKMGIEIRGGVHAGQIERSGRQIGGIAVHIGQRVAAAAAPGDVLVSGTVRDLEVGSGFHFEDRGIHHLKGVPGEWRLFSVAGCPPEIGDLARRRLLRVAQARGVLAAGIGFVVLFVLAGLYMGVFGGEEAPPSGAADGAPSALGRRVMEGLSGADAPASAAGDAGRAGAATDAPDPGTTGDAADGEAVEPADGAPGTASTADGEAAAGATGDGDGRAADRITETPAPAPVPDDPAPAARPRTRADREPPAGRVGVEPGRTRPGREADAAPLPRPRPPDMAGDAGAARETRVPPPADAPEEDPAIAQGPRAAALPPVPAPGRAETSAPAPERTPPAAAPAGPPAAEAAPGDADPDAGIRGAIARLQRAIVGEDLGALRDVWPALGETEARNFEHWFDTAREIRARFDVLSLEPVDDGMRATVQTTYEFFNESTGREATQSVRQVYELRERGGEWVVVSGR